VNSPGPLPARLRLNEYRQLLTGLRAAAPELEFVTTSQNERQLTAPWTVVVRSCEGHQLNRKRPLNCGHGNRSLCPKQTVSAAPGE